MKKIVLLCSAGMSTSMLVKKMQAAAEAENYACEIAAYPMAEAGDKAAASAACTRASRALDKAVAKGVIHKNQAANRKSGLQNLVNGLN